MTDCTKLIERLREYKDYIPAAAEAAQAIEALQAENGRLKSELDKSQDEIHCAESSLEAFSCEFESEVFNQGFDCLGDFVQALWAASNGQRDALRSQLDDMSNQVAEPAGYKLVPLEPTREMLSSFYEAHGKWINEEGDDAVIYRAMLAAAPRAMNTIKWAPEEIADGMRGIRWVMPEGVFGRPTDHDVREYLLRTESVNGCQCDDCKKFYTTESQAAEPLTLSRPDIESYVARFGGHCRDCADERGICPNSGMPCDSSKAIKNVLGALDYGFKHGFIAAHGIGGAQ